MFWRNILSSSSGLKETVCFSEMLVSVYECTWCHNLGEIITTTTTTTVIITIIPITVGENLKSHKLSFL
jgi:hypothetical protein